MRIKEILTLSPSDEIINVQAWVRTKRDSKNVCFLELNDGSCLKGLQVILDKEKNIVNENTLNKINTGASLCVKGHLLASPGKNQAVELHCTELELIGEASVESYPLQKKRHSYEFLREIAHLRPRTNTFGAIIRVRNSLSRAIHDFFQSRGFIWVHTPILTSHDGEGAGDMFQVTTLNLDKIQGEVDYSKDFFGKKTSLAVTGQLEAEVFALALKDVYTFGPTFRAENSNTTRHLSEFWMMEPEMAFCDIHGNMDLAEEFLKFVIQYVLENNQEDLDFFNQWVSKGNIDVLKQVVTEPFQRITYTKAIEQLQAAETAFEFEPKWGADLQSEHERFLTEKIYKKPVIVTDYPKDIKAFYMKQNDDGKTVRAMDILVPGIGEIIGGSEREDKLEHLERRIDELGLNRNDYWWYLELRRFGSVPHSGFGLGFERLVQYVTGMQNIRDVIPFPRTPKNCEF